MLEDLGFARYVQAAGAHRHGLTLGWFVLVGVPGTIEKVESTAPWDARHLSLAVGARCRAKRM